MKKYKLSVYENGTGKLMDRYFTKSSMRFLHYNGDYCLWFEDINLYVPLDKYFIMIEDWD